MPAEDKLLWVGCALFVFLLLMMLGYVRKGDIEAFKRPLSVVLFLSICGLVMLM
jgi:hypothetical protein